MTDHIRTSQQNGIASITLDRPTALNSLSLDMVRSMADALRRWKNDSSVTAVLLRSSSEKAFCAGGDIRFFYDKGHATPVGGSALIEDFFTEEYALNHLIQTYPKPYIVFMDGIVMGGGMGISQAGPGCRMRIVTERTKMAMPEVNIGLFPDVGGGYFLARTNGCTGLYLGLTGAPIGAADALYAGLADVFVPSAQLPLLASMIATSGAADAREAIREFARPFFVQADPATSTLARARSSIDRHFNGRDIRSIMASLATDESAFSQQAVKLMRQRSPLMLAVSLEQVRRGATLGLADCLRMERTMVRHCFEHGEVLEGIRALVIDKDNMPRWNPSALDEVSNEMVDRFFSPAWPEHAHPLRDLA